MPRQQHLVVYTDTDAIFNAYEVTPYDVFKRYYNMLGSDNIDILDPTTSTQEDIQHKLILSAEPNSVSCDVGSVRYLFRP